MQVTFCGAVREVTGSMHLITSDHDRILLDCGMFQGKRKDSDRKNRTLPFDPEMITNVVLSHAHIDHSGRIPLLTNHPFNGRVLCTRATTDACGYLLPDSAHIQESDADYLNYKTLRNAVAEIRSGNKRASERAVSDLKKRLKKNGHRLDTALIAEFMARYRLEQVEPLYTVKDAERAMTFFDGRPYNEPIPVGKNLTCTFYEAGHILGSAISVIRYAGNGRPLTVGYTGDLGRFDKPILKDPAADFHPDHRRLDLLIMESTYGNRTHEPVVDLRPKLKRVITDTHDRGGAIVIPAFAFGRTQELIYYIHDLYNSGDVPRLPVFIDSPLATRITRVFGEHPEVYDRDTHNDFLKQGKNPFLFDQVHYVSEVADSMALMRQTTPHIVISASGMCEAGRILHHLRYKIHNERNTILIVGYMAEHTLGRRILESGREYAASGRKGDPPMLRFFNKSYPLRARVEKIGGFSAHGDRDEMLRFLRASNLTVDRIALVHGESDQTLAFANHLKTAGYSAFVPKLGESTRVGYP
jgi:metallo-beta-lactamase family protein